MVSAHSSTDACDPHPVSTEQRPIHSWLTCLLACSFVRLEGSQELVYIQCIHTPCQLEGCHCNSINSSAPSVERGQFTRCATATAAYRVLIPIDTRMNLILKNTVS